MAQPNTTSVPTEVIEDSTNVEFGVNLKSHEEARKVLTEARQEENEEFVYVSKLHTDVVQLLALGLLSYAQVEEVALESAKQKNDYSIGSIFDVYTTDSEDYGNHVFTTIGKLNSQSQVDGFVWSKNKPVERPQIVINSDLLEDQYSGKRFYKVMLRGQNVTTGKFGPFRTVKDKFKTKTAARLYVLQGKDGKLAYRLNGVAIQLGDPDTYSKIASGIKASGAVEIYEKALNALGDDFIVHLTENEKDNQRLFLTVFGKCVDELKENRKALRAARAAAIAAMTDKAMTTSEASAQVNATV